MSTLILKTKKGAVGVFPLAFDIKRIDRDLTFSCRIKGKNHNCKIRCERLERGYEVDWFPDPGTLRKVRVKPLPAGKIEQSIDELLGLFM